MVALAAHGQNIRAHATLNSDKILLAISLELEYCAMSYCGLGKTDDSIFDEAVDFVLLRFGHIGVSEIREAFRLAASKEIDADLTTYYGQFTIKVLGDVLSAYNLYRNRALAAFALKENENVAMDVARRRLESFDLSAWATNRITSLKAMENPSFRACSVFDYEKFLELGFLVFSADEKRKAWEDAHFFAFQEIAAGSLRSISIRRQMERVQSGIFDEGYRAKRIVIAQQLLVFRWLHPDLIH